MERWKDEYARHEADCSEDDDECDGLKTSIDALGLQNRTWRCLQKEGILTIEDILDCEFSYLISIRNMGIRSIRDLVEVMESKGYDVSKLMPPATRKYNKAEG